MDLLLMWMRRGDRIQRWLHSLGLNVGCEILLKPHSQRFLKGLEEVVPLADHVNPDLRSLYRLDDSGDVLACRLAP